MEIFALLFAVALIAAVHERSYRKHLYPPGVCMYCPANVSFNWKIRAWYHTDTGQLRAPTQDPLHPEQLLGIDHSAYPTHRADNAWMLEI